MSSIILPDSSTHFPNGVRIRLERANRENGIDSVTVARELERVIRNDAEFHGVVYDGQGFKEKVFPAFSNGRIQAYFLIVERENCLPVYAGGAIQFPTVITEWNAATQSFEHFPAVYSEDTWVDRNLSDEVRLLTKCREFPNGVGLGTLNTKGRIVLSTMGIGEDLPFDMVSKGRISENASDNIPQLTILSKFGAPLDLTGGILQFDNTTLVARNRNIEVDTHSFGAQPNDDGPIIFLPNIFLTSWANADENQRLVGTHTQAISTTTGDTILRSQYTSNGNLPPPEILKNVMAAMVLASEDEVFERGWVPENSYTNTIRFGISPIIRAHAYEHGVAAALKAIGGKPREFGPDHLMLPAAINHANIPDSKFRSRLPRAKPLAVIKSTYASYVVRPGGRKLRAEALVP